MTDRFHSLTVVLKEDMREDDAQMVINAIRMIRYVNSVHGNVSDLSTIVAESRVKREIYDRLMGALK